MEWKPYPHQERALRSNAFEILLGGARGPGKTDAGIVWLTYDNDNPRLRQLVIRKNSEDLTDWVDRASRMFIPMGAVISGKPPVIRWPSGAICRTGHLKDDQAYTKYQGHEYQRILIEELTQIPDEKRYLQLIASCRSTIVGIKPQVFSTTNPGGVGHGWVKRRFVDPSPPNTIFKDKTSGRTRIFIPATIDDNPALMENDPDYVKMLDALKDTDVELWKAWRLGDWNTFAGQFFKEFRTDIHVVKSFTPKRLLPRYGGIDWGRTAPFAFLSGFLHVVKMPDGNVFHRVFIFQECYGTDKLVREWSDEIKKKVNLDEFNEIRIDPATYSKGQDGGESIAIQFKKEFKDNGYKLKPANNDRISGAEIVHKWLSIAPDGLPYLLITENCHNLIRTLPELIHDESKVEDVDTTGEDHAYDALRYLLYQLKWIDGKIGGVRPTGKSTYKEFTPLIDPNKFTTVRYKKKRDWRTI